MSENAGEQLLALEEAVREAEQRREAVKADQRKAKSAVSRAEGERFALEERRGAGEDVDEEEIAATVEAIEAAQVAADERLWTARLAGAERAIEEAKNERDAFGAAHFAEIAAEEAVKDGPARDALAEAWEVLQGAANTYAIRVRVWHRLARYGRVPVDSIPNGRPLAGDLGEVAQRFEAGLPIPTPRALR